MKKLLQFCRKIAAKCLPKPVKRIIHRTIRSMQLALPVKLSYSGNIKDLNRDRETILIACSAERTECSLLTVNIIQEFRKKYNVVVVLLEPGELIKDISNAATLFVNPLSPLRNEQRAGAVVAKLLKISDMKFAVITNTKFHCLLPGLSRYFIPSVLLFDQLFTDLPSPMVVNNVLLWPNESIFKSELIWQDIVKNCPDIADRRMTLVYPGQDVKTCVQQIETVAATVTQEIQQEKKDFSTIEKSGLLDLDFYLPAHWAGHNKKDAIRCYVRTWASHFHRRKPYPGFHPGIYLEQNQHVMQEPCDPFAHYIKAGKPAGPWEFEVIVPSTRKNKKPLQSRIALHLHVYYPDLIQEMIGRLSANDVRPDLLISVPSQTVLEQVNAALKNYEGQVFVQIVPHRGRDVGPFLITFRKQIVENYDIIGHLHTKKTLHYDAGLGNRWLLFLLENLLGGAKHRMADSILAKMEADPTIGLVFPDDPYVAGWLANRKIADQLAAKLGLGLWENFNFPIGTMFWARTEAIKPLFDLNMEWEDCPPEPLPLDGTLLHTIERLFPFVVRKTGFRTAVTNVPEVTRT